MRTKYVFILAVLFFAQNICFAQANKKTNVKKNADTNTYVEIITDFGNMKVVLYNDTPLHKANFIKLVSEGYYDSLLFHRVIKQFMIQGGDPDSKNAQPGQMLGNGGPGYTIPAEIIPGKYHKKGVLSAARTGDAVNPEKASAGSQFYIVQGAVMTMDNLKNLEQRTGKAYSAEQYEIYTTVGGSPWLDNEYTVFGEVVEGLDVIDKIAAQPVDGRNRPEKDIRMSMKIVSPKK